jgi:CheY-like chemotaxis protein
MKITPTGVKEPRKVCIVENDMEVLNKIGSIFLNAGYVVNPARNGVDGIERIANLVPDVALIKLGLVDIPGDDVIFKLKNMAKTRGVKYILYTENNIERAVVVHRIGQKEGVDRFIEFINFEDLLKEANEVLKGQSIVGKGPVCSP